MPQVIEANIFPDGQIEFLDKINFVKKTRVKITILEDKEESSAQDWKSFVGRLEDSPSFNDDPVAIQKALRDEWD